MAAPVFGPQAGTLGFGRGGRGGAARPGRGGGRTPLLGSLADRSPAVASGRPAPAGAGGYSGPSAPVPAPAPGSQGIRSLFGTAEQRGDVDSGESPIEKGTALAAAPRPVLGAGGNSWAASRARGSGEDELAQIKRAVGGILNKLTPEKYDSLSQQLLDRRLGVTTRESTMRCAIEQIFVRAVDQPIFCEMYATLCSDIQKSDLQTREREGTGQSPFRRLLLQVVQEEYDSRLKEAREADGAADAEASLRARKRKLGCTQFVGHLYGKRLLNDAVQHTVIQDLLYGGPYRMDEPDTFLPPESELEVLAVLLPTVGRVLEERAQAAGEKSALYQGLIREYFAKLQALLKNPMYTVRLRFKIQDILDFRKEKWPDKCAQSTAKKLADFEREAAERERQKLEGVQTARDHGGDSSAWGRQAAVGNELRDIANKLKPAAATSRKKGRRIDESGWTAVSAAPGLGLGTPSAGAGGGGGGGGKKAQGSKQPQAAKTAYAALAPAAQPQQQKTRHGKGKEKEKEKEKEKAKEKETENERKEKKEKKDKKEDKPEKHKKEEAEEVVDRPCPVPEDYDIKVGARAAEWADLEGEEAEEFLREDIAELIHGSGVEHSCAMPLLVHELCRVACACSDDGQRASICRLFPALVAPDGGDPPLVPVAHAVRGLGWFLATVVCERLADDCPRLYSRHLTALRTVCPPETMYAESSRVFVVGLRAVRALLEERGELEYLAESVQEIFDGAWGPLHDSFDVAATGAESAEWQPALLAELVSMNSKTGWMDCAPAGDSPTPLLAAQAQRLVAAGLVGAEQAAAWRGSLAHTAQEKAKKKAGRDAAAALERLGGFFSALGCAGGDAEPPASPGSAS